MAKDESNISNTIEEFHHILIITTGGTIEKTYDEFDGSLENKITELEKKILFRLRLPYMSYEVRAPLSKDSLLFNKNDRETVLKVVQAAIGENRFNAIIVIHGTDTMDQTANFLRLGLSPGPKLPVIFTGAMKPMGFVDSDATQNVTEALLASKFCQPGVFISFHGEVFSLPNVRKNKNKLTFEKIK